MELETERLLLRPFSEADLKPMLRYAVRTDFYLYLPIETQTPATVTAFLKRQLERQKLNEEGYFGFAIELKLTKASIGSIRIEVRDIVNRQGDVGFALDQDYQNHGYMSEALTRVLQFGFDKLALRRIWATCDIDNRRSWRLMERVGMQREGHLRSNKLIRGNWHDSYLYAMISAD